MIIEDSKTGNPISQGILEIIAIFHKVGIMPDAIYTYQPELSSAAGSQPPFLHLLSAQMLKNLSHAEWSARQAAAVANHRPGDLVGPELPSSSYRVHVSYVRHEMWLELVLWSCLHGSWIVEGAAVLAQLFRQKNPAWAPLSWREVVFPMVKAGEENLVDWSKMGYLFNISGEDQHRHGAPPRSLNNTISSEVVSAYVDGLVNIVRVGVRSRGMHIGEILNILSRIQKILRSHHYGLESTSWDVVVQKLLESESFDVEEDTGIAAHIFSLSSTYAEDRSTAPWSTRDEQWRPLDPSLHDGSAVSLGLSHRILRAHVKRGDIAAAFDTFKSLQAWVDKNKMLSLTNFFRRMNQVPLPDGKANVDFRSRYTPQADPNFYTILPPDLMGEFLDLITEVQEFGFGSWLLASIDVDGPTIGTVAFRHLLITPALVRFLAAIRDENLLAKLLTDLQMARGRHWPSPAFLLAVLDSQLALANVDGAKATVGRLIDHRYRNELHTITIASLLSRAALKNDSIMDYTCTIIRWIFVSRLSPDRQAWQIIAALLMPVHDDLKHACLVRSFKARLHVSPPLRPFNNILEGLVYKYGSARGQEYVQNFCSSSRGIDRVRATPEVASTLTLDRKAEAKSLDWNPPHAIDFSISTEGVDPGLRLLPVIHVSGWFKPMASTIRVILTKRLAELKARGGVDGQGMTVESDDDEDDGTPQHEDGIVQWCISMLEDVNMSAQNIRRELRGSHAAATTKMDPVDDDDDQDGSVA